MPAWILAKPVEGGWEYWTGQPGHRSRSAFQCDAYHFRTAESARECAGTHKETKDSDEWRVVPARAGDGTLNGLFRIRGG